MKNSKSLKNVNVTANATFLLLDANLLPYSHSECSESFNRLYEGTNKMLLDSMGQVNYHCLDMVRRV